MKKSYVALLIALVVVCLASCALAVAPCDPSVYHTQINYVQSPSDIPGTVGVADIDAAGNYFYATTYTVGHTWVYQADSTATCTTFGKVHKKCSACGYEVILDNVKDPANHADKTWGTKIQTVKAENCSQVNTFVQLCNACKVAWETTTTCGPHAQTLIVDEYATCVKPGNGHYTECTNPKCVNKIGHLYAYSQEAKKWDVRKDWKDPNGSLGVATEKGKTFIPALGHLEMADAWYTTQNDCCVPVFDEDGALLAVVPNPNKEGKAEYLCGRVYSLKKTKQYVMVDDGNGGKKVETIVVPELVPTTATGEYMKDWKYCDEQTCPVTNYDHALLSAGDHPAMQGKYRRTAVRILVLKKIPHNFAGEKVKVSNKTDGLKNGTWGDICYYEAKSCNNIVRYIDANGKPQDLYYAVLEGYNLHAAGIPVLCHAVDHDNAKAYPHTYEGWKQIIAPADDHNGYWTNKCTFSCSDFGKCGFEAISINPTNDGTNPVDKTVDVKKTQKPTVKVENGKLVVTINDTQDADSYKVTVWVKGDKSTAKTYTTKTDVKKIKVEAGKKYCVTTAAVINTVTGPASSIVTKNVK